MRGRVLAQGFTVAVLFAGVTMTAKRPDVSVQGRRVRMSAATLAIDEDR